MAIPQKRCLLQTAPRTKSEQRSRLHFCEAGKGTKEDTKRETWSQRKHAEKATDSVTLWKQE